MRLTKRGRAVLTALVATPLVIGALLFAINGGGAAASLEGSTQPFQYVTVDAGQSLWEIAQEIAPSADPRDVIAQVMQLNRLDSADVFAGVRLAIPAQYDR
ncbi:MAG: LysM peptidoglycan-binding domain-containing protein [Rhodoglobus sp.]